MEVSEAVIKNIPRGGVVKLVTFACTHFGHAGISYDRLQREIDAVADDPLARWIHLGDTGEYITSKDPRWDIGALDPDYHVSNYIDLQVDRNVNYFKPIRRKGIGFIMGNHEDKYLANGSNPALRIATTLNNPFLGHTALIRLRLVTRGGKEWTPILFAIHGATGATTLAGQMNYLKRISAPFGCDVAAMAHVHRRAADNNDVYISLNDDATDVRARQRHYVLAGTFMRTYFVRGDGSCGYGEKKYYPPSALGCSSVEFHVADRVIRAKDYWT